MGIGGSSNDDCSRCCHLDIEGIDKEIVKLKEQIKELERIVANEEQWERYVLKEVDELTKGSE